MSIPTPKQVQFSSLDKVASIMLHLNSSGDGGQTRTLSLALDDLNQLRSELKRRVYILLTILLYS